MALSKELFYSNISADDVFVTNLLMAYKINQQYGINDRQKWCPGTVCVIGDSILSYLDMKRLDRNFIVKLGTIKVAL